MLTNSSPLSRTKVRKTVCLPVTGVIVPASVRQVCQPPVLVTDMVPIAGCCGLSMWISIRPPSVSEATRASNWVAGTGPKSKSSNRNESPLAIQPTFFPPPSSSVS